MHDVIAIFPKVLDKPDLKAMQVLTEAAEIKSVKMEVSDIVDFCRIGLGFEDLSEVGVYELIGCNTLVTLMMSQHRPIFCVRRDEEVLGVTSLLGKHLSMAEHVLRPLAVVQGHARNARMFRTHLRLPDDTDLVDVIDNQIIPAFQGQLDELVDYCRQFYAARAHTEA